MIAIRNLATFGKGRKDVLDMLMELANDRYVLIQITAVDALGELRDERAMPLLESLTKGEVDGRLMRAAEDAIRKIYTWLDTDIDAYRIGEEIKKRIADKEKK